MADYPTNQPIDLQTNKQTGMRVHREVSPAKIMEKDFLFIHHM